MARKNFVILAFCISSTFTSDCFYEQAKKSAEAMGSPAASNISDHHAVHKCRVHL